MSGIAGKDNLKPNSERSAEEVRNNQRKGGINSGKSRRRKKGIREAMQALLDNTYNLKDSTTGEVRQLTGEEAIALSIMQEAMNKKSKNWAKAVQYALQLTGEDKSKVENELIKAQADMIKAKVDMLTGADTTALDKLDELLKEQKDNANTEHETE